MGRRLALLLGGVCAAAALTAGLAAAQDPIASQPSEPSVPPTPPPAATAPPAAETPAADTAAPAQTPPSAATDNSAPPVDGSGADAKAQDNPDQAEARPDAPAPDPSKRQVYSAAVIQALDKITTETMRFEVTADRPVRWKGLVFTLKSCQTSAPDAPVKDAMAFLLVRSEPQAQSQEASREIFRGWMFANSPALNPLKHPLYDAWLIGCRA